MSRSSERRLRRFLRDSGGQSLVELAMVAPVLLILLLGVVEFGRVFEVTHAMTGISREGANIAARGAELDEVLDVVLDDGESIGLRSRGGAVVTRVVVTDGTPRVVAQLAAGGYLQGSRYGRVNEPATGLDDVPLTNGQVLHAVEIFYDYRPATPFERLSSVLLPDRLYERALF